MPVTDIYINHKYKNIPLGQWLYLAAIFVMFTTRNIGFVDGQLPFYAGVGVGSLLIAAKILTEKHNLLEYTLMLALIVIAGLSYINTGEKGLLIYYIIMLGAKDINIDRTLKSALSALVIPFPIMCLLTLSNVYQDKLDATDKLKRFGIGDTLRKVFAYSNPNVGHTILFCICLIALTLCPADKRRKMSFWVFVINVGFFLYSFSFTGMLSCIFTLLAFAIICYIPRRYRQSRQTGIGSDSIYAASGLAGSGRRSSSEPDEVGNRDFCMAEKIIYAALFILLVFFSLTISLILKGDLFWIADKIFNNRVNYSYYFLTHERVTLLGSRFTQAYASPGQLYFLDNSFLYLFLQMGVIPFVVTMTLFLILLYDILKQGRRAHLAMLACMSFIAISDQFLFNASLRDFLFILLGSALYGKLALLEGKSFWSKEITIIKTSYQITVPGQLTVYPYLKMVYDRIVCTWQNAYEKIGWKAYLIIIGVPILGSASYLQFPQVINYSIINKREALALNTMPQLWDEMVLARSGMMDGLFVLLLITIIMMIAGKRRSH